MATPRFEEVDGEIYDRTMGTIIPMDEFRRLSRGKAGDQFARDLASQGGLADTDADLQSSPDAATLAAVANPEADAVPDEDVTPITPQQTAARADAQPVAASAAPTGQLPQPRSARPPLDEWMEVVGARNPGVSPRVLRREWAKQVGAGTFYDPKDLPTWEDYQKDVTPLNPSVPPKAIRNKWEEDFGDFGAREKPPTFVDSLKEGLARGWYGLRESSAGTIERLQNPNTALQQVASDAGDLMAREAAKHAPRSSIQSEPWYKQIQDNEWLGDVLGSTIAGTMPSMVGAVVGGVSGGPAGAAAGVVISTYFQVAGTRYREAYREALQSGSSDKDAHEKAYTASGVSGIVSGVVNSLGIPASYITPFTSNLKNLFTQYVANIAVDVTDQASQNALEGKPLSEGMTATIVGSAALGSPETMIAAKSIATGPGKATPPELKDVTSATTIEDAAAAAGKFVDGAKAPKAPGSAADGMTPRRPTDLATQDQMRAAADLEAQEASLLDSRTPPSPLEAPPAPERTRTPYDVPLLEGRQPRGLLESVPSPAQDWQTDAMQEQPPTIVPGLAFTPRQPAPPTPPTPEETIARERAKLVSEREAERERLIAEGKDPNTRPPSPPPPSAPVAPPTEPPPPVAPPSLADTVASNAAEVGIQPNVLLAMVQQISRKSSIEEMTPTELRVLTDRIDKLKAKQAASVPSAPTVTPVAPAKQDAPLAPEPLAQAPEIGPMNVTEESQKPRNELPPEQNAEMLARAEKAQADLEIAGSERGGLYFMEQEGAGSTQDVRGLKSPTADWFKKLTHGPGKLSRKQIEVAVSKIIQDEGVDRGVAVERVKLALLQDREFAKSPWGREIDAFMRGEARSQVLPIAKEPPVSEGPPNPSVIRADNLLDLVKAEPFRSKGFGGLDVPAQRMMMSRVFDAANDRKVLDAIIGSIPVDVMNMLRRQQVTPEMLFHEKSMFLNKLPFNSQLPISSRINAANAAIRVVADLAAEPQWSTRSSLGSKVEPALGAVEQGHNRKSIPLVNRAGQTEIEVPPETSGSRPIIGREATPEEAPLFSKAAQEPDAEQTSFAETKAAAPAPKSPTAIIADALRNAADQIAGNPQGRASEGPIASRMARIEGEGGKVKAVAGMDPRIMKVLGGNLYSGDLGKIATKEMIQNAVDSVKEEGLGARGSVSVRVDTNKKTFQVIDNGKGMTPDIVMKELVDIGGSKKGDDSSGGFGIAKVAIFANAKMIDVKTRAKMPDGTTLETHLTGSGDDWMDQSKGLSVESKPSREKTGTDMTITLKDDVSTNYWSVADWMKMFQKTNRLPMEITLTIDGRDIEGEFTSKPLGDQIEFDGGTIQFYGEKETQNTSSPDITILNNGLPQFKMSTWVMDSVTFPQGLIADVRASGDPEGPNYPFSPDRERLRDVARQAIDSYVKNNLAKAAIDKERQSYVDAIESAPKIGNTSQQLFDTAGLYTEKEMQALADKPYVQMMTQAIADAYKTLQGTLALRDEKINGAEFRGIGLGPEYLGVNIKGEMIKPGTKNLILVNPYVILAELHDEEAEGFKATMEMEQADLAAGIVSTIVHELSHEQSRGHDVPFAGHLTRNQGFTVMQAAEATALVNAALGQTPPKNGGILNQLSLLGGPHGTVFEQLLKDYKSLKDTWHKGTNVFGKISTEPSGKRAGSAHEGHSHRRGESRLEPEGAVRDRGGEEAQFLARSAPLRRNHVGGGVPPSGVVPPTHGASSPEDTSKIRQFLGNAKKSLRPFLLGSLSLSQVGDVYGKAHPEAATYNRLVQDMKADFIHITNQADPLIRKWDKLDKTVSGRMAAVMEDARVTKYDPDMAASDPPVTPAERRLVTEFRLLPDDAKALYREVRGFYKTLMNDRFDAIIQRIERTEASDEEKRDAVDEVSEIKRLLNEKVYFPLMRFGNYVMIAKKMVDGKEDMQQRVVATFESAAEAQRQSVLMRGRGFTVKQTTVKEYNPDADGAASGMTQRLLDVIEKLPGTGDYVGDINTKKDLKDAINQLALHSLPDMSYAKHFLHAKDVKGASVDALRAFAHSALHGAHHISRIRHSDQLSRVLRKMDSRIEKTEGDIDVTEARQVHNELVQRHQMIINPNTDPFAAFLGQVGFTMSLGGVVATGVTNMTQTPLITLPFIGSRYGFAKATTELGKAYNDFFTFSTLNRDSLFDASKNMKLPQHERDMLKELQRRGKVDLTQTMDISGRAAQDNLSRVARSVGTKRERIMQMLGFTFHAPEVMNRQVTALATYRLERAKGSSYENALDAAAKVVDDTHYIYTQENRARYMSGNVMRVLTMFKQYGQNVAFMYGKAAHTWLAANDATPTEKKEAKKQLLLMFGFQLGAAGYLGVPFMGTVASLLTALMNGFGDDDEKKDWETELRKIVSDNLVETFGEETGKWAAEIAAHGLSRATPWDLAGRLGQGDLFIRPPKMEREGRAAAWDWMTSLMGPVAGYGVNAWLGVEDLTKAARDGDAGHFMRGTEELMPAVLRHAIKAVRYEVEGGVRTRDQHLQLETTWYEELGQIFGFAPKHVAEMYEGVTAIRQKEHRIETYRNSLLDRFAAAVESGDDGEQEKVLEKISAFNDRTPILHISGDTLRRSLRGRAVHEARMEGGVYLPRTREPLRDEGRFANY